ncbi:MAG: hypothetical protein EXX96DRAFT_105766 [Benjaminiella poitrasii]|nr:MAG: hypothetical protein EXX96DRAFT_105766 [Benjaminiella poitrasii]
MMHALKEMMWERRKPEFTVKLSQFIQDPEFIRTTEFTEYFKRYYLDNDAFMMWTAVYQPQMYTNTETNNYIESWHNQLKTMYLKRKRNRRVDRLVYILVNDVEQDYIHNIQRISNNVGRLGPEERRQKKKGIGSTRYQ